MTRQELAKKLYDTALITGTFLLRSGQTSDKYFDKYLFEADATLLREIAKIMAGNIPAGTEVLGGLEMGGIPVVTAIGLQTGHPMAFVRKEAKTYGTCKIAEGAAVEGKRVTIVEDVVNTSGAIIDNITKLRKRGAIVEDVICVLQRGENAVEILAEHGLRLVPAFTMAELLEA